MDFSIDETSGCGFCHIFLSFTSTGRTILLQQCSDIYISEYFLTFDLYIAFVRRLDVNVLYATCFRFDCAPCHNTHTCEAVVSFLKNIIDVVEERKGMASKRNCHQWMISNLALDHINGNRFKTSFHSFPISMCPTGIPWSNSSYCIVLFYSSSFVFFYPDSIASSMAKTAPVISFAALWLRTRGTELFSV